MSIQPAAKPSISKKGAAVMYRLVVLFGVRTADNRRRRNPTGKAHEQISDGTADFTVTVGGGQHGFTPSTHTNFSETLIRVLLQMKDAPHPTMLLGI